MENEKISHEGHYLDIKDGVDNKTVNLVMSIILSFYVTTPIQGILLGIGIYRGFTLEDNQFMFTAVAISIILMLFRGLFYDKASDLYDRVVGFANTTMWDNINKNVSQKYGEGKLLPLSIEVEKVTPPYKASKEKIKVMWNTANGHEKKILQIGKGFEPMLTDPQT